MSNADAAVDPERVETLRALPGTAWRYLFARAAREFVRDHCQDLAAALTYRSVFALFPALLAVVSLLGLFGQAEATTTFLVDALKQFGSEDLARLLEDPIQQLAQGHGAGWVFAIGVTGAIWTASNYVVAFGRAMNRIYSVPEGRPFWMLRPAMFVLTLALLLGALICVAILVLSGSVARTLGDLVGLGEQSLIIWDIAKWPVLLFIVIAMIACLYYFTPNVKRDRFPWLSVGAIVALLALGLATAGFGFYLSNFANFNRTYGSIGGVIILLLWIWIMNSVLLLGAEIDAESERARELQSGLPAERDLQLPARSEIASKRRAKRLEEDVTTGRNLRALANPIGPEDVPPRHTGKRLLTVLAAGAGLAALYRRARAVRTDLARLEAQDRGDGSA